MKLFYMLANTDLGTLRIRHTKPTTKEKAVIIGITFCAKHNLEYIGTYDRVGIDKAETKFRIANY